MRPCFSTTSQTFGVISLCKFCQVVYKNVSFIMHFPEHLFICLSSVGLLFWELPVHIPCQFCFVFKIMVFVFFLLTIEELLQRIFYRRCQFFVDYMHCKYLLQFKTFVFSVICQNYLYINVAKLTFFAYFFLLKMFALVSFGFVFCKSMLWDRDCILSFYKQRANDLSAIHEQSILYPLICTVTFHIASSSYVLLCFLGIFAWIYNTLNYYSFPVNLDNWWNNFSLFSKIFTVP